MVIMLLLKLPASNAALNTCARTANTQIHTFWYYAAAHTAASNAALKTCARTQQIHILENMLLLTLLPATQR